MEVGGPQHQNPLKSSPRHSLCMNFVKTPGVFSDRLLVFRARPVLAKLASVCSLCSLHIKEASTIVANEYKNKLQYILLLPRKSNNFFSANLQKKKEEREKESDSKKVKVQKIQSVR